MAKRMTTREWQKAFAAGEFDSPDFDTQCKAGWFDWFCKKSSLARKTNKMGKIIARVQDGGKVDLDRTYCWFKNNCPFTGPLYDDFRFADIETGNTLMTIAIDDKRSDAKYVVWGRDNDFDEPLFKCGDMRDLVAWLNAA